MKSLKLLSLALLLSFALFQNVTCPVDDSSSYFTGTTKTDVSGKLLKLYKCNGFGHKFWVVDKY